jgi:hypothetical protein
LPPGILIKNLEQIEVEWFRLGAECLISADDERLGEKRMMA